MRKMEDRIRLINQVTRDPMTTAENIPGIMLRHRLRGGAAGGEVTQTAWSPDGQSLAVCSMGSRLAVWDFADRPVRRDIPGERGHMIAAWSPGATLVTTSGARGRIQDWDIGPTPKVRHTTKTESTCLAWSPDGSVLVSGDDKGSIKFWGKGLSEDGSEICAEGLIYQISWHPGGRLLASASRDGLVKVWTWPQRELYAELGNYSGGVNSVAWSPDGRFLASASDDRTIQVWDLEARTFRVLDKDASRVYSVAFSPCGRLLASRGNTDGIQLWRGDRWAPLAVIEAADTNMTRSINFHPKLPLLAAASGTDVHIWDLDPELLLSG